MDSTYSTEMKVSIGISMAILDLDTSTSLKASTI